MVIMSISTHKYVYGSNLVGPADEVEVVFVEEVGDPVWSEGVGDAAVIVGPTSDVSIRVGPQEIAQEALIGDVDGPLDGPDLIERVEVRGEAAVHAEDLAVDQGGHGEAVEAVGVELP